jgi:hypothetical protein
MKALISGAALVHNDGLLLRSGMEPTLDQMLYREPYTQMVKTVADALIVARGGSQDHPHCIAICSRSGPRRTALAVAITNSLPNCRLAVVTPERVGILGRANMEGVKTLVVEPAQRLGAAGTLTGLIDRCRLSRTDLVLFMDVEREWIKPILWMLPFASRVVFDLTAERDLAPFFATDDTSLAGNEVLASSSPE